MGQVHSDEYSCGDDRPETHRVEDVADSEINTKGDSTITTAADQQQQQQQGKATWKTRSDEKHQLRQQHVRKLSNVSHRNIQLLSMKPRSDRDAYADNLRTRRRSSLINLILGAPSSGPRFCDDLCSLSSYMSETNFGIESFPEPAHYGSTSTLRLASIEDTERGSTTGDPKSARPTQSVAPAAPLGGQRARRSSIGSLAAGPAAATGGVSENPAGRRDTGAPGAPATPSVVQDRRLWAKSRNPSLASTLASIDLSSSFEQHDKSFSKLPMPLATTGSAHGWSSQRPPLVKSRQLTMGCPTELAKDARSPRVSRGRVNQSGRILRRSGSELSLYSTISASSAGATSQESSANSRSLDHGGAQLRETKLIILLQVALPFMLAGFGNMAAGLVLDMVAQKRAFVSAPILFVLLPPLIGLKGNIEMTLASRLSTLSNLNLLQTRRQKSKAFGSNLALVISQAIGLSLFAALVSVVCELSMLGSHSASLSLSSNGPSLPIGNTTLAVFASALITSVLLVVVSSVMMSCAIGLANLIQVNPDNLSTLIAALYGDVSCVYVYGLVANWTFSLVERDLLIWPSVIVICTLLLWPLTLFMSYKFKETHSVAFYSIPPMIISILISMGSGALLSLFVGKFRLIALYQPVVNGFGANLVAVQASRVSTWLWCSALGKLPIDSGQQGPIRELKSEKIIGNLASFTAPPVSAKADTEPGRSVLWKPIKMVTSSAKLLLWSFCNSSPNAIAAKLLLLMLIPAHTIYFFVIWLLSATSHVVITWPFYSVYIGLCLVQVFILLTICEPFMTLLMSRNMDPDVFGISILMAVADLTGTICLTSAFFLLASIGDVNALQ